MKITCLIDSLGSGGAQRQLVNLAVGFTKRGHQVRFLTYYPDDFYLPVLQKHGIEYICHAVQQPTQRVLKFRRELRRGGQDAVLAFLETPALLAEMAAFPSKSWRLVVGERNTIPNIRSYKEYLPRLGHNMADFIVANSVAATETLHDAFPRFKKRISTIYNLIDLEQFSPSQSGQSTKVGIRKLVIAASYISRKNLQGLLDAVMLLDEEVRTRLCIDWFGDYQFEYYEECQNFIQENNLAKVIYLNPATTGISEVMQGSDAVGLFSLQEGLPNTICEGLATGKPIITSNIADAKVLVDEGENGWLCDPQSPATIAKALEQFLKADDAQLVAMGEKSRRKAELLFNYEAILDQYLELLERSMN